MTQGNILKRSGSGRVNGGHVNGAFIVGCGPSGMSISHLLNTMDVPHVLVEREDIDAPLWRRHTYDSLKLELPKKNCELLDIPMPSKYPEFISKEDLVSYFDSCLKDLKIYPRFNEKVTRAEYDELNEYWKIVTESTKTELKKETEYLASMLVVATGMNTDPRYPDINDIKGLYESFAGKMVHSKDYENGKLLKGKRVLVIGAGNSGIDISLDLEKCNAIAYTVVRNTTLDLPCRIDASLLAKDQGNYREDQFVDRYGSSAVIRAMPRIAWCDGNKVGFVHGKFLYIDFVVLATGYNTNVLGWLKGSELFADDGFPTKEGKHGSTKWKGEHGLYAAGFSGQGLYGVRNDAYAIGEDVSKTWARVNKKMRFIYI